MLGREGRPPPLQPLNLKGLRFSKVLYIVTLYSKYTRALSFENLLKGQSKRMI
jgi:hypothetical protein